MLQNIKKFKFKFQVGVKIIKAKKNFCFSF